MGVNEKYTELELRNYVKVKNLSKSTILLGIFEKNSMLHIGNIKYEPIDFQRRFSWIGLLLGEVAYRNMGLAGEVILASSHFLKEKYYINKLKLGVHEKNLQAISAYRKVGFNIEEVSDSEHQLIMVKNLN
jgi:RimJ/RimL family protein N-acetyltransferase